MTKLEEIEKLLPAKEFRTQFTCDMDKVWLIDRVKKLEHIILESKHRMSSHTSRQGCADTCYACWARKALEEE